MPNLVGIGNSQVPTNAMLGGLAYQDSVGEINIEKIKARTSDTALGVFVYDTRKDSDGGAWRYRTQNTSWYDEVVSAERGARREFPSVAVIVVTSTLIIIYDGDDPNLPMWMVLNETSTNGSMLYSSSSSDFSGAVSALNGNIYYGMTGNGTLGIIEFVRDGSFKHRRNNRSNRGRFLGRIADRRLALGFSKDNDIRLAGEAVSDIATTVLPNAPIETSTGLPIPTIAAATDGGTSIIKDNGTIVDIVYSGSPNTAYVDFRKSDNAIVMSMNSNGSYVHVIYDIPTSDISGSHQYQKEGIDDEFYRTGSSQDWNQEVWIYSASPHGGTTVRIADNVISGNGGINVLAPNKNAIATDTMVARIASSFNSGYMHGDIKGAFLSSIDDTNLAASDVDLVTNGTFASDSNWTKDSSWTISGGTATNSGAGQIYQTISVVTGKKYLMTATVDLTGDGAVDNTTIGFRNTANSQYYASGGGLTANTVNNFSLYWTSTITGNVRVRCYSVDSVSIDNWSVQDVSSSGNADRSVNNKGLKVFGTITKTPVATGAELVAYSGFTSSNYLEMPSGDIGVNTSTDGPLTIMCWYKGTTTSAAQSLVIIGPASNHQGRGLLIKSSTGELGFFRWSNDPYSSTIVADGAWHHCVATVESNSRVKLYVDGNLVYNDTITLATSSSTQVRIGYSNGNNAPLENGSLALVRISNSVASLDQIKKIYEDEKCLYHENAKCTLHGTSDAVTGLAFDDTNNVLHVGTSAGRSEFQGLNRINNTTTAVTTAISVSNEFVAEQ